MSMPRVLHLAPLGGITGAVRSMEVLVAGLQKQGATFVVTLQEDGKAERLAQQGVHVTPVFGRDDVPHARWKRWSHIVRTIQRVVRQQDIQIMHCHSAQLMRYAWPASLITGVPIVCHQRELYERRRTQRWLGRADRIIAISQAVYDSLPNKWHRKTDLVYNAVAGPAELGSRETGGQRIRIGVAGRIVPEKGQDLVVRAAAELLNEYDLEVEMWGWPSDQPPNDYTRKLMAAVEALGEQKSKFHFEPMRDDMERFYARMDIVVVPSRWVEPLGRVAIEAMAWGCPVIVAGHGGLVEIVQHESNGLTFEPDNWEDLKEKIEQLLADPPLRDRLRTRARRDFEGRFKPDAHVGRVIDIYEQTLKSRKRSA